MRAKTELHQHKQNRVENFDCVTVEPDSHQVPGLYHFKETDMGPKTKIESSC